MEEIANVETEFSFEHLIGMISEEKQDLLNISQRLRVISSHIKSVPQPSACEEMKKLSVNSGIIPTMEHGMGEHVDIIGDIKCELSLIESFIGNNVRDKE